MSDDGRPDDETTIGGGQVDGKPGDGPSDETVVRTAAESAEGLIFSRYRQSDVRDVDVTVTFEDGVLDVDVYLNAPEGDADEERVADDAVEAAREAVDELFGE